MNKYTGCVIKIRTNFNLNFSPYCAFKRHSWRVSLMFLINSHKLKMATVSTPGREYNRRAAIIEDFRAGRSPTEIIRFFGDQPFMIWQNIVLQNNQTKVPVRQRGRVTKNARTPAVVERTQALISEDPGQSLRKLASICGCKRASNASNCRERFSIQIIHIKDRTDPLRGCQDQASCSLQSAVQGILASSNSPDLNLLNYYVWSVVERVTNKSRYPTWRH